jgi:hypothetical protein
MAGLDFTFPDFIIERNRQAAAAGLTIERQDITGGLLTTWYRGTEEQWRASAFCFRTRPFNRSAMYSSGDFYCFSPGCTGIVVQRRPEGDYRGSVPRERLPGRTRALEHGVVVYEMNNSFHEKKYFVYVGDAQALIDIRIAPQEILDNRHGWDVVNGHRQRIWERRYLKDGRCCFWNYFPDRKPDDPNVFDDGKRQITRESQLTARWAGIANLAMRKMMEEFRCVETDSGRVFTVTGDACAAVEEAIKELVGTIRCAQVTTKVKQEREREDIERVVQARTDGAFREFMKKAGLPPAKPGASTNG